MNFHESKNRGALQTFFGKTFIFGAHRFLLLHTTHFQFTFSLPRDLKFLAADSAELSLYMGLPQICYGHAAWINEIKCNMLPGR